MDAEVCAALSLDLAAPRAPSSMSVLPSVSAPPLVCSGGGGIDVDGTAASEAFFFDGMLMKENEDLARVNAGSGSHNLDAPYLAHQRCLGN